MYLAPKDADVVAYASICRVMQGYAPECNSNHTLLYPCDRPGCLVHGQSAMSYAAVRIPLSRERCMILSWLVWVIGHLKSWKMSARMLIGVIGEELSKQGKIMKTNINITCVPTSLPQTLRPAISMCHHRALNSKAQALAVEDRNLERRPVQHHLGLYPTPVPECRDSFALQGELVRILN